MARKPQFDTFTAAVEYALENEVGTRTAVCTLVDAACEFWTGEKKLADLYQIAVLTRSKFRRKHRLNEDCRTYNTQFRRDMFSDKLMGRKDYSDMLSILGDVLSDPTPRKLQAFLKKFHSLEQVQNVLKKQKTNRKV